MAAVPRYYWFMVNRVCWKCGITAHMSLPRTAQSATLSGRSQGPQIWDFAFPLDENGEPQGAFLYVIFVCDECGYPSVAKCRYKREGYSVSFSEPLEWIPSKAEDHQFSDVPKSVADAANEAYKCFSVQAYRASVIMARSVLEGIANEKISEPFKTRKNGDKYDKTLKEKIEDMVTEGVISKGLGDKANVIKEMGNSSTHNVFEEITESDAAGTLDFLELVIQEVYTHESQLQQLGKTVEGIKKKKRKRWWR